MAALDPYGLDGGTTSLQANGAGSLLGKPEFGNFCHFLRDHILDPLEYGNERLLSIFDLRADRLDDLLYNDTGRFYCTNSRRGNIETTENAIQFVYLYCYMEKYNNIFSSHSRLHSYCAYL